MVGKNTSKTFAYLSLYQYLQRQVFKDAKFNFKSRIKTSLLLQKLQLKKWVSFESKRK